MILKNSLVQLGVKRRPRTVLYIAGAMIVAVSLGFLLNALQKKEIKFVCNGEQMAVDTKAETLQEFLKDQGIHPDSHDFIQPGLSTPLHNGMQVVFTHRTPVTLTVAGSRRLAYTQGQTIQEVLNEQRIKLNPLDKVEPPLNQEVKDNSVIFVSRISQKIVPMQKTIAFNTEEKQDGTLARGQSRVIQDGQPGKAVERYEVVYTNGKPTSKKLLDARVLVQPKSRIMALGTANMVTASRSEVSTRRAAMLAGDGSGLSFTPREVLDITMTAYSSDPASNGYSPNDPGRMITKTGTKLTEGRTIAVDPSVVPLGWWVYIEGYGFRRAEDTGGAIQGDHIDLFFNSEQDASDFGVQRKKVYVIGPNKPE
ncbi:G5 domain-containing protein [Aneurinibacillus sp. Ricciae_BoGa-3]|uniref:3D domain-containing protein n=1 Tax=Aneurinibacillus sp. Ricciae_BoGa-3 TaxID=3022697 RepID=UPI0023412F4E|nr:3D domain-containing protein [Aneurinibacillus sp. Ricciae_BoGa-3]WCK54618.1 G5 domain-containing protein [Aneurinibacillus sp. Ricciae_BoGa-3]